MENSNQEQNEKLETYHLEPGYIYIAESPTIIRTVLGSCVAVSLWDRKNHYAGMNHFLYPAITDKDKYTAQYGNVAVRALIKMMVECGCEKSHMEAQIFGGAKLHNTKKHSVGEENIKIAEDILRNNNIPIISKDTGGHLGRKILFDTTQGHAAVLKVRRLRNSDWIE